MAVLITCHKQNEEYLPSLPSYTASVFSGSTNFSFHESRSLSWPGNWLHTKTVYPKMVSISVLTKLKPDLTSSICAMPLPLG